VQTRAPALRDYSQQLGSPIASVGRLSLPELDDPNVPEPVPEVLEVPLPLEPEPVALEPPLKEPVPELPVPAEPELPPVAVLLPPIALPVPPLVVPRR
jgi:hypothetical protein